MEKFNQKNSKYGIQTRRAPWYVRMTPWFIDKKHKKVSVDVMPYLAKILDAEKKKRAAMDITPHIRTILEADKRKQKAADITNKLGEILKRTRA